MTRLLFIGVTKISTIDYFHNDKATMHFSKKNINKRLPSIMTKLPSIGVTKMSIILPSIMTRLAPIGVTEISTTECLR